MNVLIRSDASLDIGSGHVMRCLALADALRARGMHCRFVCRAHPGHLIDKIRQRGFEVHALPHRPKWRPTELDSPHAAWLGADWRTDVEETKLGAGGTAPDWLIVDHYALDARWERAQRPHVAKIMVIDDLADRAHDCDLLLDQNLQARPDRYQGLVPETCQLLLGPRFALLRPQFHEARKTLRPRDGQVRRILVAFGGVDAQGATLLALEAIARLGRPDIAVDVVITTANPHRDEIEARCAELPNVRLQQDVEDMADPMAAADLAIGAGGSMSWERCCLGLPTIVMATADNQLAQSEDLVREGAQLYLGRVADVDAARLARVLDEVLRQPAWLAHMAERGQALVDGRGCQRVVAHILASDLHLRRARMQDCEALYAWRNHPDVRTWSSDSNTIDWYSHERWFGAAIGDSQRDLLIAEYEGQPIGVLRYDVNGDTARVSVYLVPGITGRGWGTALLVAGERWLRSERPRVRTCEAEILGDNRTSLALFAGAGFRLVRGLYAKELNEPSRNPDR